MPFRIPGQGTCQLALHSQGAEGTSSQGSRRGPAAGSPGPVAEWSVRGWLRSVTERDESRGGLVSAGRWRPGGSSKQSRSREVLHQHFRQAGRDWQLGVAFRGASPVVELHLCRWQVGFDDSGVLWSQPGDNQCWQGANDSCSRPRGGPGPFDSHRLHPHAGESCLAIQGGSRRSSRRWSGSA